MSYVKEIVRDGYKVVFEEGDADCKPVFAPVGEGNLNFPEIVRAARSSGAKYFFVEQDNACILPDPWGEVTKSVNYIKERL